MTKTCKTCKTDKSLIDFTPGFSVCMPCNNKRSRERYANDPDYRAKRIAASQARYGAACTTRQILRDAAKASA